MFRRLNQVIFVLLLIVGAVAALPTLGVVDAADCAFEATSTPAHTRAAGAAPSAPATLSMSLRAGDMRFADALRSRVEDGVMAVGTAKIIDNPQTYPRATVTMSAVDGRWTPFWARLRTETKVVFDRTKARGGAHDVDATVVVDGRCFGLVSRDAWSDPALDVLAKEVVVRLTTKAAP